MKELPAGCLETVIHDISNWPSSKPDIPYIKIHDTPVKFFYVSLKYHAIMRAKHQRNILL